MWAHRLEMVPFMPRLSAALPPGIRVPGCLQGSPFATGNALSLPFQLAASFGTGLWRYSRVCSLAQTLSTQWKLSSESQGHVQGSLGTCCASGAVAPRYERAMSQVPRANGENPAELAAPGRPCARQWELRPWGAAAPGVGSALSPPGSASAQAQRLRTTGCTRYSRHV